MKVLIVTPYFYPSIGGTQSYVLTLARELQNSYNHQIVIATSNQTAHKFEKVIFEGITVYRLPVWLKLSNTPINPLWYFYLKRIIAVERPDIINSHSPVPFIADMAYLAKGKLPFVFTYHSGSMKKGTSTLVDFLINAYEKSVLKYIVQRSSRVISVYPEFLNTLLNQHNRKILFIPPAVDTHLFTPSEREQPSNKTILFVGRIERSSKWKGIATLLQALPAVLKAVPDVQLKLIGSGDAIAEYTHLAKMLGIENNVQFLGDKHDKNLVRAYQDASVLVLPSETDSEAFGIVLIEAMSCGIPVIGSRIGGIPSVITDRQTGILTPIKDAATLAKNIVQVLTNNRLATSLSKAGREHVIEHYSVQKFSNRTNKIFKNLSKPA